MAKSPDLQRAEIEAAAARQALAATMARLQRRFNPQALLMEATKEVRDRTTEFVSDGIDTARRHPAQAAAVTAGALAWLLRKPIARGVFRLFKTKPPPPPSADLLTARAISAAPVLPPAPDTLSIPKTTRSNDDEQQGDGQRQARPRGRQRKAEPSVEYTP